MSIPNFTPDLERSKRTGQSEVIYGASKTPEQIVSIFKQLIQTQDLVIATKVSPTIYNDIKTKLPKNSVYHKVSGLLWCDRRPNKVDIKLDGSQHASGQVNIGQGDQAHQNRNNCIVVVSAGTSDAPIALEAAIVARLYGSAVNLIQDVGVAGVQRLLNRRAQLEQASVIVVVAGMEGALASVVAGLVKVPVIAVPTSVGYGAAFAGLAPLLGMLNSCSGSVATVNIDGGYIAGNIAHKINCPSY